MELIAQGAEAKLYTDGKTVLKERPSKSYRHPRLDKSLRQFRTRRESKILKKLQEIGVAAPELIDVDDKEMTIKMSKIKGEQVKEALPSNIGIAEEIGKIIGTMHSAHIIHSDLTTSNMIYDGKVHMIDFGLSFVSHKVEDKAVDLYLFRKAVESAHHEIAEKAWDAFIKGYKEYPEYEDVLRRLEVVEKRGRYSKRMKKD